MSETETSSDDLPLSKRKRNSDNSCCTEVQTVKFSYTWTIKNFPLVGEGKGKSMQSLSFSSGVKDDEDKWCLELYPQGDVEEKDYVGLYLRLLSTKKPQIRARTIFSILDAKGVQQEVADSDVDIFHINKTKKTDAWGFGRFIARDRLLDKRNRLLVNDNLTILCKITIVSDPVNIPGQKASLFTVPKCQLIEDLGSLLENPKLSDVTIIASGREFQAHKLILTVRSSVFAAMFKHPMEENKCSRVEITDMNHEVVQEMLQFIYTGQVSNIDEMASDLLFAADKYDLGRLKIMCEEVLHKRLAAENAAETLLLADRHNAKLLKEQALDFISKHVTEVTETPGFQSMIDLHPRLVAEAFLALGKACKN